MSQTDGDARLLELARKRVVCALRFAGLCPECATEAACHSRTCVVGSRPAPVGPCVLLPQLKRGHSAPTLSCVGWLGSGGWGEVGESSVVYRIFGNVAKSFSGWHYLPLAGLDDIVVLY